MGRELALLSFLVFWRRLNEYKTFLPDLNSISYFRVAPSLCFKARLSAKRGYPLLVKSN